MIKVSVVLRGDWDMIYYIVLTGRLLRTKREVWMHWCPLYWLLPGIPYRFSLDLDLQLGPDPHVLLAPTRKTLQIQLGPGLGPGLMDQQIQLGSNGPKDKAWIWSYRTWSNGPTVTDGTLPKGQTDTAGTWSYGLIISWTNMTILLYIYWCIYVISCSKWTLTLSNPLLFLIVPCHDIVKTVVPLFDGQASGPVTVLWTHLSLSLIVRSLIGVAFPKP